VPDDRKTEGVMLRMPSRVNLTLPVLDMVSRFGFISSRAERAMALETMNSLDVKQSALEDDVASLSGGNQQKIAIGKWLRRGSRLFLMYDPTRGVDVGTKEEIYGLLRDIASRGNAVLVYSTDTEELLTMSDRVLVMYRGKVVRELDGATCTRAEVLVAMLGGAPTETADQSVPPAIGSVAS
jgi:ribose transport system ATP-binding protein